MSSGSLSEPGGGGAPSGWARRYGVAAVVLAVLALLAAWFERGYGGVSGPPLPIAYGHREAAARQQGAPTTGREAVARIAHDMAIVEARTVSDPGAWSTWSELADLHLARARITGAFEDYAAAGQAYAQAFKVAAPGTGPNLERAGWNFAVHRLDAIPADLKAAGRYVVGDDVVASSISGLEGDVAFYNGRYAEALDDYRRSEGRIPTVAAELRMANWYARMGAPAEARREIDASARRLTGPQQQLKAYLEFRRGLLDMDVGDWDSAEAHFLRADDIFPDYWLVQQQLGTVKALKGDTAGAMAIFRTMAAGGELPEADDDIAGLYRAEGDLANAQLWAGRAWTLWRKRLALLPEAAYGHALDHLLAFGDTVQALDIAKRNYALRPYGESATGLAWAYMANHRPADALQAIRPTLASRWYSAEPHIVASEAYALLGQGDHADTERKAALAINPHSFDRNPGMTWLEQ